MNFDNFCSNRVLETFCSVKRQHLCLRVKTDKDRYQTETGHLHLSEDDLVLPLHSKIYPLKV